MEDLSVTHMNAPSDNDQQTAKTILIVEDDMDIGEFLVSALQLELACHCLLARDGVQAMEQVRTIVPDLLIIDYQLPNMNGLELYDHLQTREELRHVPALVMSANLPGRELEKRSISALQKPFAVEELLQKIQSMLGEPEGSRY